MFALNFREFSVLNLFQKSILTDMARRWPNTFFTSGEVPGPKLLCQDAFTPLHGTTADKCSQRWTESKRRGETVYYPPPDSCSSHWPCLRWQQLLAIASSQKIVRVTKNADLKSSSRLYQNQMSYIVQHFSSTAAKWSAEIISKRYKFFNAPEIFTIKFSQTLLRSEMLLLK